MQTKPLTIVLVMLPGWIKCQQKGMIESLREENKILREKFGKKRIILNDDQRHRLAEVATNLKLDTRRLRARGAAALHKATLQEHSQARQALQQAGRYIGIAIDNIQL